MNFTSECIAWIDPTGCSPHIQKQFHIMSYIYLGITSIIGIFFLISIIRRYLYLNKANSLFYIMTVHLLIYPPLQIFYDIIIGFSFKIPPIILTLCNVLSYTVIGNTIPQIIIAWMESYSRVTNLRNRSYQKEYWIVISVFTLAAIIAAILMGLSPSYYFIWMRVVLSLWGIFLISCGILMFYYGVIMYKMTASQSIREGNDESNVQRAHRTIKIILIIMLSLFLCIIAGFLFYIIKLEMVEASLVSIFIWYFFKSCGAIFVLFWSVYFWINTDTEKQLISSLGLKTQSSDFSPRSKK
jgi:hypothetical protein